MVPWLLPGLRILPAAPPVRSTAALPEPAILEPSAAAQAWVAAVLWQTTATPEQLAAAEVAAVATQVVRAARLTAAAAPAELATQAETLAMATAMVEATETGMPAVMATMAMAMTTMATTRPILVVPTMATGRIRMARPGMAAARKWRGQALTQPEPNAKSPWLHPVAKDFDFDEAATYAAERSGSETLPKQPPVLLTE
jgi:hypothetical protein